MTDERESDSSAADEVLEPTIDRSDRTTLPDRATLSDLGSHVGDPPRTTLPDDLSSAPVILQTDRTETAKELAAAAADLENPKRTLGKVPWVIGAIFVMAVLGPMAFYFLVWRFQPTAAAHLPEGAVIAVRLDGRELYTHKEFREQVLGESDVELADAFKKHTGIDLRTDVREIVFATTTGENWVYLLGGAFGGSRAKTGHFAEGVLAFLEERKLEGFSLRDDTVVGRAFIAKAEDGTILIASDELLLDSVREPNEVNRELGLASSGALSFVVTRPALEVIERKRPGSALGEHCAKLTGYARIKGDVLWTMDAVPTTSSDPESLAKVLIAMQAALPDGSVDPALDAAAAGLALQPDWAWLKSASIKPRSTTVFIETTGFPFLRNLEGLGRLRALGPSL